MNQLDTRNQSLDWARFDVSSAILNILISLYFICRFNNLLRSIQEEQRKSFRQSVLWCILCMILSTTASIAKLGMKLNVLVEQPMIISETFHCDAVSCLFCVVCQRIFIAAWLMRYCFFFLVIVQCLEDHFRLNSENYNGKLFTVLKIIVFSCESVVSVLCAVFQQAKLFGLVDARNYITCFGTSDAVSQISRPINGFIMLIFMVTFVVLVVRKELQVKFYNFDLIIIDP